MRTSEQQKEVMRKVLKQADWKKAKEMLEEGFPLHAQMGTKYNFPNYILTRPHKIRPLILFWLEMGGDPFAIEIAPPRISSHYGASIEHHKAIRKRILQAIEADDVKELEKWKHRAKVARLEDESTLLHYGAAVGAFNAVNLLLEWGLDPNAQNKDGKTAVEVAAQKRQWDMAKLLVERGAKPQIVLPMAENIELIKWMDEKGASPPADVLLSLVADAQRGEPGYREYLEKRIASSWAPLLLNNLLWLGEGDYALKLLRKVLRMIDANERINGWLPLDLALKRRKWDMAWEIWLHGGRAERFNMLNSAIEEGNSHLIGQIVKREPRLLEWRDETRFTPLYMAVIKDDVKAAQTLLDYGVDKEKKGPWEYPPLAYAKSKKMVDLLWEEGYDPKEWLKIYVKRRNREGAEAMLEKVGNWAGRLQILARAPWPDLVEREIKNEEDLKRVLKYAILARNFELVRRLLERIEDPSASLGPKTGHMLFAALKASSREIVEEILERYPELASIPRERDGKLEYPADVAPSLSCKRYIEGFLKEENKK